MQLYLICVGAIAVAASIVWFVGMVTERMPKPKTSDEERQSLYDLESVDESDGPLLPQTDGSVETAIDQFLLNGVHEHVTRLPNPSDVHADKMMLTIEMLYANPTARRARV